MVERAAFIVGMALGLAGMVLGWIYGGSVVSSACAAGGFVVGISVVGLVARGSGWKPESDE